MVLCTNILHVDAIQVTWRGGHYSPWKCLFQHTVLQQYSKDLAFRLNEHHSPFLDDDDDGSQQQNEDHQPPGTHPKDQPHLLRVLGNLQGPAVVLTGRCEKREKRNSLCYLFDWERLNTCGMSIRHRPGERVSWHTERLTGIRGRHLSFELEPETKESGRRTDISWSVLSVNPKRADPRWPEVPIDFMFPYSTSPDREEILC